MSGKGNNSTIEDKIDDIGLRLKRIEDFIWPPTEGGNKPIDPTGGPGGPPMGPMNLGEIVDRIKTIEGNQRTYDASVKEQRKLYREISELRKEIEAYQETVKAIKKMGLAPAG